MGTSCFCTRAYYPELSEITNNSLFPAKRAWCSAYCSDVMAVCSLFPWLTGYSKYQIADLLSAVQIEKEMSLILLCLIWKICLTDWLKKIFTSMNSTVGPQSRKSGRPSCCKVSSAVATESDKVWTANDTCKLEFIKWMYPTYIAFGNYVPPGPW